jgi:hypothetical protein
MVNLHEERKPVFTLSASRGDFRVEYYNGTGNGGQNRNKVATSCRIHHPASGALATCQEERTQVANRRRAFERHCSSGKFKNWLRVETGKRMGAYLDVERIVEKEMRNVRVDLHDEKGRWVDEKARPDLPARVEG